MRLVAATLLAAATSAFAQAPATPPEKSPPAQVKGAAKAPAAKSDMRVNCADCAEIRSIRQVTKELRQEDKAPAQAGGLVASIPLGGGKPTVGSSTKVGDEAVRTTTQWEVTLRYDDGRYRLLTLDRQPDFGEGSRVRIDSRGQLLPP